MDLIRAARQAKSGNQPDYPIKAAQALLAIVEDQNPPARFFPRLRLSIPRSTMCGQNLLDVRRSPGQPASKRIKVADKSTICVSVCRPRRQI